MKLSQQQLRGFLETGIVAARLAGQKANEQMNFVKREIKNGNEVVTQADSQCQKIIIDTIKESFPDHGFIAEEGTAGDIFKQKPRTDEGLWWIIDPIDGTNNFANKMLLFAVSIALMHDGEPVVGVIFDPSTDSMFSAVIGGDAMLNDRKISASNEGIDRYSSTGLDSHYENGVPEWTMDLMKQTKFRNLGTTALQMAYVAKGSLIATIVKYPKLWDIAAGACIVKASGAIISGWGGEDIFPVDLDNYNGEQLPTIAANKKTHSEFAKMISEENR